VKTVVVFARWPAPGRVKTRLAPALSGAPACDLHVAMLKDTLAAVRGAGADRRVLCWADAPADALPSAIPGTEGCEWSSQGEGALGERLERALATLLAHDGRIVFTGSDAPEITSAALDRAFLALATFDLVIGPTPDGGYHLIGLSRIAPGLFHDVAWSTPYACDDTLRAARALGLSVETLAPLADVDTGADLAGLIARLSARPGDAPATAAMLQTLGLVPQGLTAAK
jgi:rSAM/selenodomain-associated transferase 1